MSKSNNRLILFFILLLAAILRFYHYREIPFTHDELSALSRIGFSSFSDLIQQGVIPDGHPAGVQVFLYYWVKLFGDDVWVVKFPFTIFGLLSVWLVYLIGSRWFNETTGLLSAAFFATVQYTVLYSQVARPYSSGLFFSLLMVFYWSRLMQSPEKGFLRNSIFFVISASLSAYNHYFSLLFAFIVGISGLLLIRKQYRIRYMIAGVCIALLYLPHLKIFLHHLQVGGVGGWLSEPQWDFFYRYLAYIFNFSLISLAGTLLVILYGAPDSNRASISIKHYLLFFSWFMIPLLVGFFYSKYVNAVLQYSVLIFSFSYLLFLLFGHIKPQNTLVNLLLVTVIAGANVCSLIYTRDHYSLFYQSPYKALLTDYREAGEGRANTVSLVQSHRRYSAYFSSRMDLDTTGFIWLDSFEDEHALKCFLEEESMVYEKLYLGSLSSLNPLTVPLIRDYYPGIEWQRDYAGATSYLFNRTGNSEDVVWGIQGFESEAKEPWHAVDPGKIIDSVSFSGHCSYLIDEHVLYGPAFSVNMEDLEWNDNDFIEISAKVRGPAGNMLMVASLESRRGIDHWSATAANLFAPCSLPEDAWFTVHHVLKLSDIHLNHRSLKLTVYPWNREGDTFMLDDFRITLRHGNPVIYGLTEPLK
jgi:hypothetical protein